MTRIAAEVLARPYGLQPTAADGAVTTEWATHDEGRWPGLRTRVEVQITSAELIVLVHCVRREREPCSRVMPDGEPLVRLAQRIAHDIIKASPPDRYLARMRVFKDELCACQDDRCATRVLGNLRDWGTAHVADIKHAASTSTANAEARRLQAAIISCARRPTRERAPSAITRASTGSPECDEYLATFDAIAAKCQAQLGPAFDAMKESVEWQAKSFADWATLDETSRKEVVEAAATGCQSATNAMRNTAESMGCSL